MKLMAGRNTYWPQWRAAWLRGIDGHFYGFLVDLGPVWFALVVKR